MPKICYFFSCIILTLGGCGPYRAPTIEEITVAQTRHDAFTEVCFQAAHESIHRNPSAVKKIYLSRPSKVMGSWEFELFFGTGRPRVWANAELLDGPSPEEQIHESGTFEVRYTHVPVTRHVGGTPLQFHGVRQEIIDLSTGEVIAERENYVWGNDFNRSAICIGSDWFSGNDNFLDRVLGHRYRNEAPRTLTPERYVKANMAHATPTKLELRNYTDEEALPPGSARDYNQRKITLPNGSSFGMPGFFNAEPLPVIATLATESDYLFVLLPGGHLRNWPLRQILLFRRDKAGQPLEKVYVQLPKIVDWSNGWGVTPTSVSQDRDHLYLSIYGKKTRTGPYSDQSNFGKYSMRYDFVVPLSGRR